MWLLFAVLSALFAGLTAILAKGGLKNTDSDAATAMRTSVVLVFAWVMALITGEVAEIHTVSLKAVIFLVLSGTATGLSWLFYFRALQLGTVREVAPVDKASTVLSMLLAMLLLGETNKLFIKLPCMVCIAVGTYLMLDRSNLTSSDKKRKGLAPWLFAALLSTVFAALTAILGKIGVSEVPSNLATALRTCIVFLFSWGIVFGRKKGALIKKTEKRELLFLILSGFATGASWLCYYRALQGGPVSVVAPIDKLSILPTLLFARIFYKEKLKKRALLGLLLVTAATLSLAIFA